MELMQTLDDAWNAQDWDTFDKRGLIGPPGTPRDYTGSFNGTRVFIGCSDVDAQVPLERVRESTAVLSRMQATVDERIYRGMGHPVNEDELRAVEALLLAGD